MKPEVMKCDLCGGEYDRKYDPQTDVLYWEHPKNLCAVKGPINAH